MESQKLGTDGEVLPNLLKQTRQGNLRFLAMALTIRERVTLLLRLREPSAPILLINHMTNLFFLW